MQNNQTILTVVLQYNRTLHGVLFRILGAFDDATEGIGPTPVLSVLTPNLKLQSSIQTHHKMYFGHEGHMQSLEIVEPGSDACETGLCWESLQTFDGANVASLVLWAESPPRFRYGESAIIMCAIMRVQTILF